MAKKKIIQLPRGYLSFSQVSLWQSSRERYKKLYFDGDQSYSLSNPGLTYGSIVAEALEHGKETGDLLTDTAMELLTKYDTRDVEIQAEFKTKYGYITILGKPDMLDSETFAFREVKTGKVKWTQKKAEKWLQLRFYATLIYLKHGVIPPTVFLDWIETFVDDGVTKPTGHIETFEVEISMKDVLETLTLISRVAKAIEMEWVVYTPPKEIPF